MRRVLRFRYKTKLAQDIHIDDSVATNGVCLTAIKVDQDSFTAQAVHITLKKSNLAALKLGQKVNLELALRPMDRMGGHFVQGHVNGVGALLKKTDLGKNIEIEFSAQKSLFRYMIPEGSIAIDGIFTDFGEVECAAFFYSFDHSSYLYKYKFASKKHWRFHQY